MKFIHTSDWHIGRQFHNVSLLEDQRHVLDQLIEHIKNECVDAVVIAGDIYDRSVPPAAAVELLDDVLNKICMDLGVPVLIIPGNHDGAERLRFGSRQLRKAGLHIIGELTQITEPVIISGAGFDVSFYGIPYNDPETVRNHFSVDVFTHDEAHRFIVEQINSVKSDETLRVLISHCFIDGGDESDSERPLSIGGADRINYEPFVDFDYVALGHLHSPQHKGKSHIRYSGSILKYSFSEQRQNKGVTLVEMDSTGIKSTTHLPLMPLRDMRIVEGELNIILEQGKVDPNNEDYLLVRLTDRHAILDPMGKLRQVYPNVLHLEKPGMLEMSDHQASRDKLKCGEFEMFRDFFEQVHGKGMSPEQDEAIKKTIAEIITFEGGVA
ncbi:exonuclease SbcCD subunit D [Methylobacter psychrophilus]|uniref:exonuclease SbcCD subunit D n=1 Tax=Methylobacter psychrophilus TaxID=96941 RepID=UPI0021D48F2D|nr:exonuclease SbcCD subunit D [Methylobacter psychrophilus]